MSGDVVAQVVIVLGSVGDEDEEDESIGLCLGSQQIRLDRWNFMYFFKYGLFKKLQLWNFFPDFNFLLHKNVI